MCSKKVFILLLLVLTGPACQKDKAVQKIKKNQKISDFVAVTTTANLNMRTQPHRETARILLLPEEMILDVLNKTEHPVKIGKHNEFWYHLRAPNGITGWVYGNYLILVKREERERAIEIARERIREEKQGIIKNLSGYWQQVFSDGSLGKHRLVIYPEGEYLSLLIKQREAYTGSLDIDLQKQRIYFKARATFGSRVNYYHDENMIYGMTLSHFGQHSKFELSGEKPPTLDDLIKKRYKIYME